MTLFAKISNRLIQCLFGVFTLLALIFAIFNKNMYLLSIFTFVVGVLLVAGVLVALKSKTFMAWLNHWHLAPWQVWLLMGVLYLLQLAIFWQLLAFPNWDPGIVMQNAPRPKDFGYFSIYPNTIFLLLVETRIHTWFPTSFTQALLCINLLMVDLTIVVLYYIGKFSHKPNFDKLLFFGGLWMLGLSSWILVFYSDTLELPFMAAMILTILVLPQTKKWLTKFILAVVFGFLAVVAYWLKPTSIIFSISLLIVLFLNIFQGKIKVTAFRRGLLYIIIAVAVFLGFNLHLNNYAYHQLTFDVNGKPTKLDHQLQLSPYHFIMMGMRKNGSYTVADFKRSMSVPTYKARVKYNQKMIQKRLAAMGPEGYTKFLFKKFNNNTGDGTFAFNLENHLVTHLKRLRGWPKIWGNFLYHYGRWHKPITFLNQVTWITLLFFVFLSTFQPMMAKYQILRICQLAIVGLLIYLLIFEGGRTRYLFMWVPLFLVCGAYGFESWYRIWQLPKQK